MGRELFSIGRYWSFKLFIPISSAIFAFLKSYAFYKLAVAKAGEDYDSNIVVYTPPLSFLYTLSCVLTGLGQLILNIQVKEPLTRVKQIKDSLTEKKSNNDITKSNITMVKNTPKHNKKYYLMILSVGLLSLITSLAFNVFEMLVNRNINKDKDNQYKENNKDIVNLHIQVDVKNIQIVFSGILSIFILKTRFETHQGVSIGIIMLGLFIVNILNTIELKNEYNILLGLGIIANFFLSSLLEVLEKFLMEAHFISPFKLKFFEGIVGLGICIIPAIIALVRIDYKKLKGEGTITSLSLFIVLYFLSELGTNSLNILTNFYYSPTQRSLTDALSSFLWNTFSSIFILDKEHAKYFELQVIGIALGYPISFIGALIYNELIIIHLCGMDKGTKKEMLRRSDIESKEVDLLMNNISQEEDSEEQEEETES